MTKEDLKILVIKIIQENNNVEILNLVGDMPLRELGLDSLDLLEVIVRIEQELMINLKDNDLDKLENFGEFIDYIYKQF